MQTLSGAFVNPYNECPLMCRSTGTAATADVSNDLLNAQKKGDKAMESFISEGKGSKSFYDPLKKMKLKQLHPCKSQGNLNVKINW